MNPSRAETRQPPLGRAWPIWTPKRPPLVCRLLQADFLHLFPKLSASSVLSREAARLACPTQPPLADAVVLAAHKAADMCPEKSAGRESFLVLNLSGCLAPLTEPI